MPTFVQDERVITYAYCEYAQVYYLELESDQGMQIIQAMTLTRLKQLFKEYVLSTGSVAIHSSCVSVQAIAPT